MCIATIDSDNSSNRWRNSLKNSDTKQRFGMIMCSFRYSKLKILFV